MKVKLIGKEMSENIGIPIGTVIEVFPNEGPDSMSLGEEEGGPCPWQYDEHTPFKGQPNATTTWYLRDDEIEEVK